MRLAFGLVLAVGPAGGAEVRAENGTSTGALAESRAIFAELPVPTNRPASAANRSDLGTLVDSRLVTNAATPLPGGLFRPAPSGPTAKPAPSPQLASVGQGRNMDLLENKQKLRVGDRLSFQVMEDREPARPLTISDAGNLDVPELGVVPAVGKTCKQLAYEIKAKLEQTTYYTATVILNVELIDTSKSGRRIYVTGAVQHAGIQELPAGETWTVAKAIMRAGGFGPYAKKSEVKVSRTGEKGAPGLSFTVNVAAVLEKGRMDQDRVVEAEDLIYVPTKGIVVY